MCPVLVDYHQSRLHCRHDITALILIVRRRLLFYRHFGIEGRRNRLPFPTLLQFATSILEFKIMKQRLSLAGIRSTERNGLTSRQRIILDIAGSLIELLPVLGYCRLTGVAAEWIIRRIVVHLRHLEILHFPCLMKHRNVGFPLGVEIYRRHIVEASQRVLHGSHQYLPYRLLVLEFYLCLSGVYIHVDIFCRHIEIYEIRHLLSLRNESLERCQHRLVEIGMLHIPAVDEEILMGILLFRRLRFSHKTMDTAHRGVNAYRQQVLV